MAQLRGGHPGQRGLCRTLAESAGGGRLLVGERTKRSRREGTPAARENRIVGLQPLTEYRRCPSSALVDLTVSPIFLPRTPDINPRTECACQPLSFISSFPVAPPERFSRSRTLAVLLPWRARVAFLGDLADVAPLLAFFAGVAFLPDLAWDGATWALCAATCGFLAGFGCSAGVAFLPDLAWDGATWALCAATCGFLAGFGCSAGALAWVFAVSSGMPFILRSPWAVITAIPSITRVRRNCKLIVRGIQIGDGAAREANPASRQRVAHGRTRGKIRPEDGAGDCRAAVSRQPGGGGPRGRDQP